MTDSVAIFSFAKYCLDLFVCLSVCLLAPLLRKLWIINSKNTQRIYMNDGVLHGHWSV